MAKRKEESGPGTGLILVLVFFILASLVLGVTTYMGFNGQTEFEAQAKTKTEEAKKAADNAAEQTLRRNVDRAVLGIQTPEDMQALAGAPQSQQANILDEIKLVNDQLGKAGSLPGKQPFLIPVGGGGEGAAPVVAPTQTIPQIARAWYKIAEDYKAKFDAAERARKTAESSLAASQAQQEKDKQAFEASVKALNDTMAAKIKTMDAAFGNLKTVADQKGIEFKKIEDEWANARAQLEEQVTGLRNDLLVIKKRLHQAENPDPSDIGKRFERIDIAKLAERMGTISDKTGTFVSLTFTKQITLLPGQTFVVIPANTSLVEVIEREKGLEKVHHERISLGPREPFTGNELIKGMVEVTDVTGPYAARARITHETAPIRSPLTRGDQIFNMTLSSGEKDHVAFAGIVDLDGDGRPDTEAFIRLL